MAMGHSNSYVKHKLTTPWLKDFSQIHTQQFTNQIKKKGKTEQDGPPKPLGVISCDPHGHQQTLGMIACAPDGPQHTLGVISCASDGC